jgi:DNA repair protein NreA
MKQTYDSKLQELRDSTKAYSLVRRNQFNKKAKKDYFGAAPNVFIGHYGYPKVNVGFLSNEILPKNIDNPHEWSKQNYQIPKLLDLRSELINSRFKSQIKSFDDKFLELTQEVSQSTIPTDVEVNLEKKPSFNINIEKDVTPYGPAVDLKKAVITENPKIPIHVDKVVSDDELKSVDALDYLHKKGYDEHFLTKLISVGNLGLKDNRKLVPTRWSITAVDDTLGKKLTKEVKNYNEYDYVAHFGGYLGNYYLILFFPEIWSYELFETYVGDLTKSTNKIETETDYEPYSGRSSYATNTVGGYYASRLGILEYLKNKKRQSSVLTLRFITNEYYMAMGVWVVRQATRHALQSQPISFSSKELMMKYAKNLLNKKFNFNLHNLTTKSKMIKHMNTQKKILDF